MSHVETIRRAAKLIRDRAERANILMPAPWWPVVTDSESFDGVASCTDHTEAPGWACDRCQHFETGREAVAAHVAAWDPARALRIADLLDAAAGREIAYLANEGEDPMPMLGEEVRLALDLAVAYLGEDGPQ